jgi:RNA polymerase sigma-70 factor (ECF subfamily)
MEFLSEEIMRTGDIKNQDLASTVEALMLRHSEKWLRFAQRIVQNREDAEDVLQEAALRMLARGRSFCSPEQARMYLGRVICNTAIELYHTRRRDRRQLLPLNEQLLAASPHGEPERSLVNRETWKTKHRMLNLLHEGLAHLPLKQYEALRLTVMDPGIVSIRDAGIEHAIPYSTLRHRILKGLQRLNRFLHRAQRATPFRVVMV